MENSIECTLNAIHNVIELNNVYTNEKHINLYRQLFTLLNSMPNNNNLIVKLWIEHLTGSLQNLHNTIKECEDFVNYINNNSIEKCENRHILNIDNIDNSDIERLSSISIMKKFDII